MSDRNLLKEIRDEYEFYDSSWREIRDEAKKDMRYVAGDPWDPKEKQQRIDAERPALSSDELSQYVNQLINDPRQNPRGIKIAPKGQGATDKTAQVRENIIREIQYNSKAQSAFTTGFQGAVERSYGYWRVGARFKSDAMGGEEEKADASMFEQELYIGRIPNPDSVLFHPNFREMDASDAMGCFVTDKIRRADFKRKYPDAEIVDFTPDQVRQAPQWIDDKDVLVAEWFKVSVESKKLFLVENKKGEPLALWENELPKDFDKSRIKRDRKIETRKVTQYITNGVEILDQVAIPIPWIPIIPVFGKEIWIDTGGGSKRQLLSLIRLARDPYMAYCYFVSQEAEEAGMTPRSPLIGYTGQFSTDKAAFEMLNKIPRAFVQVDPMYDSTGQLLPLPQRLPFSPNFQAYELAIQGARTRIQAAMGINALPTAAQRQNEKSGVALERIETQEDRGSFHFIDNYNHALEHTGRILVAWIPVVYDTKTDVGIREADEEHRVIRINDPAFTEPDDQGNPVKQHYDTLTGEHGVTVSTGPNHASQREEANDLVQTLVTNIQALPLAPQQAAKLLSLAIKLKNIGPLGDEMADIISPPADQAAQQQAMQQGQMQLQQSQQVIQELQAEIQKLQLEKAGRVIQGEYQKQIAQINNDVKVLIAEITTQQQNIAQRMEMFMTYWKETHGAAHETGMQAADQQHQKELAAQTAAVQQSQQQAQPEPSSQGSSTV